MANPKTPTNSKKVNWLEHWVVKGKRKTPISRKYPTGCPKPKFKRLIEDYLNSWLALWNVYQTKNKRHTLLGRQLIIKSNSKTFTIEAYLNPPAKEKKHFPGANIPGRKRGGGHLVPPEPPPPPPGEGL